MAAAHQYFENINRHLSLIYHTCNICIGVNRIQIARWIGGDDRLDLMVYWLSLVEFECIYSLRYVDPR